MLDAVVGSFPAYLWMAADNPRALAFYRRNGFELDGKAATYDLLGTPVDTVRLVR